MFSSYFSTGMDRDGLHSGHLSTSGRKGVRVVVGIGLTHGGDTVRRGRPGEFDFGIFVSVADWDSSACFPCFVWVGVWGIFSTWMRGLELPIPLQRSA